MKPQLHDKWMILFRKPEWEMIVRQNNMLIKGYKYFPNLFSNEFLQLTRVFRFILWSFLHLYPVRNRLWKNVIVNNSICVLHYYDSRYCDIFHLVNIVLKICICLKNLLCPHLNLEISSPFNYFYYSPNVI